ncbi:MAG: DUF885 domain-containing protein [Acidimicrobiia bacterium]|nr:DUF885 domain-containing protein [Acidimicrobiia bacterium]
MDTITALADEFHAFHLQSDRMGALWKGNLDTLELWEDFTPDGVEHRRSELRRFASTAGAATVEIGPHPTLDLIAFAAGSTDEQLEWYHDLQLFNSNMGFHPMLLTFGPRFPLTTAEHGERYLVRMANLPDTLTEFAARIVSAVARGRVANRTIGEQTLAGLDRHLGAPTDPLLAQPAPTEMTATEAARWRDRLAAILTDQVRPALSDLRKVVHDVALPAARPDSQPGLVYLDGGAESYERLVWANVTRAVPSRRVHDIGRQQVEKLEDEYPQIAGPLLGTTNVAEIYDRLRSDPALHYSDAATLVADATRALARAAAAMGDWFGVLPKAPCVAKSIEQGPLAFYSQPAIDGSKPGTFFFNTADPSMWGTFQVEATTYHEGIPGHHLQVALALENEDLHPIHHEPLSVAYLEGWALYTERVADEMGLYSSDLDRVGMLAADSMRACRLVVDTGLHALGWSREQAIRYMLDHSPMTRTQVEGEIDRYVGVPGQALGYMMGRLEIEEIRSNAEARLADRFDIKDFHDVVLGHGDVPMETLARMVDEWIDMAIGHRP